MSGSTPNLDVWTAKAQEDLDAVTALLGTDYAGFDVVGFHCQQAAEKYLKALLVHYALPVPFTHDLSRLLADLEPHAGPETESLVRDARWLTGFAVAARYPQAPGLVTTREHALQALDIAGRIKDFCLHAMSRASTPIQREIPCSKR